jgi:hypothetical protein
MLQIIEKAGGSAALPSVASLVSHLVERIENRPGDWTEPFPLYLLSEFLPPSVMAAIDKLPYTPRQMTGARANNNDSRQYFHPAFQEAHPVAALLAEAFQHPALPRAIMACCPDAQLDDTHLLIELAVDTGTSALVPHRDIGTKRFTGLFYVASDPNLSNCGTDIFTMKPDKTDEIVAAAEANGDAPRHLFEQSTRRPLYGPGLGYFFIPSQISWHGFDERAINGLRKTIIVNYLGPTPSGERYRNVQNLCFPEQTVSIA